MCRGEPGGPGLIHVSLAMTTVINLSEAERQGMLVASLPGKEGSAPRILIIFVGCKPSHFGTLSLSTSPLGFVNLAIDSPHKHQPPLEENMQPPAIFCEPDVLCLTDCLCALDVGMCAPRGCVRLTLFSVLHCSSRKQKGYHLSFGWIVQRWKDQFPLCAGLCHERS